MKWLITGGCGFIGVNLINELEKLGQKIRIVDNLSVGSIDDLPSNDWEIFDKLTDLKKISWKKKQIFTLDLKNKNNLDNIICGVDYIVHLAASTGVKLSVENFKQDFTNNVISTLNLLEVAKNQSIKKFIFASSGAPLGFQKPPIHEGKPLSPKSPYGASKMAGEGYCSAFAGSYDLNTTILRFSNVYGPGSYKKESVVAKFIKDCIRNQKILINGNGEQTRDFIYIDDLIKAILLSTKVQKCGEIFQIASGKETSIKELARIILDYLKNKLDFKINIKNLKPLKYEVKHNFSDISKAKKNMNFEPKVLLEDGLKKTIEYYIKIYKK
tara:strand:+ start:357 stop:1337 length:981 start_codon:yes stop_codon:yes gene_type:complete